MSGALPTRKRGLTAGPAVARPPAGADTVTMTNALLKIRDGIDSFAINGVLVATRDGLAMCGVTRGIENDGLAAMAAAAAGLAHQFTAQADIGGPRAVFFEGDAGQVGVFEVDPGALLVVLGSRDTTMGMFNVVAKQALALLQRAVIDQRTACE
ncbi:MAG TPA: roadblock/LC7 domain-containing protein [Lentzea sp.]